MFLAGFLWSCLLPDDNEGKINNQTIIQYFSIITWIIFISLGIWFIFVGKFTLEEIDIINEEAGNKMK